MGDLREEVIAKINTLDTIRYDEGLRDAWSLARKVIRMDSSQQFEIFGEHGDINVLDYKSAEEALKMYREWKKKQTPKESTKAKVEALIDEGHKVADIMYAVKQIADGDTQWFDIA